MIDNEAIKAAKRKYNQSTKGKEKRRLWRLSHKEQERIVENRYCQSPKGKAQKQRYSKSEKGRQAQKQYRQTDKRRVSLKRYAQTEKGKAKAIELSRKWRAEHPEQLRAAVKKYQETHKVQIRQHHKERNRQLKLEVLTYYGNGKCACVQCNEKRIDCLSIDHINNNGYEHRKVVGNGSRMYSWLRKNNYPIDYQTLCMNCQFVKRADLLKSR